MCTASPSGIQPSSALQASQLPIDVLHKCFDQLQPKDLCRASAVCRLWRDLNRDAASNAAWRAFYCQSWPSATAWQISSDDPLLVASEGEQVPRWKAAYGCKMLQSKCWNGKFRQDQLQGISGVRCISLLVRSNLLFTGSSDCTMRAWDLVTGLELVGSQQVHGGTVRCLAADDHLLLSGSGDHHIRAWSLLGDTDTAGKGSLTSRVLLPGGHAGPVNALELTPDALFSGSWDYSVRAWNRCTLRCISVLHVDDWVSSLAAVAPKVYIGGGKEVLVYSVGGGGWQQAQRSVTTEDGATVTAVRGSLDGRYLYYSTDGGAVVGVDLRCGGLTAQQAQQRVLLQGVSGVTDMSWEYPCLGVSFARGSVAILDADAAMGQQAQHAGGRLAPPSWTARHSVAATGQHSRQGVGGSGPWIRWLPHVSGSAACVALGEQWAATGFDSGTVITWDFSRALEVQHAAAALRRHKQQRRLAAAAARARGKQ